MAKIHTAIFTAILFFALTGYLSALSIGREGPSYVENGVEWQKVCYENIDVGFIASIPGSPTSGISGAYAFTRSNYQDVGYVINSNLNERYTPPEEEIDFIQQIKNGFEGQATVLPIASNQKTVKYIAELYFNDGSVIGRIYCSKNCLYFAIVKGKDLSLAPFFFDTIKITK